MAATRLEAFWASAVATIDKLKAIIDRAPLFLISLILVATSYLFRSSPNFSGYDLRFHLLERSAFGFRNEQLHPNKLEDHHEREESEDDAGREGLYHLREKVCKQGGEYPMGSTS